MPGWKWVNTFRKRKCGKIRKFHREGRGVFHSWVLIYKWTNPDSVSFSLAPSVKRSNCYMVWGGDIVANSQRSSRSNVDLEIGCLVDLAMGMLSFSANGKELGTCYQVGTGSGAETMMTLAQCLWVCFYLFSIPTSVCPPDERRWSMSYLEQ